MWLALRVTGLFFLYRAINSIISAISAIAIATSMIASDPSDSLNYIVPTFLTTIVSGTIGAIVYAWLARYFLMDGRRVLAWVDARLPDSRAA
jgi:hypothetical protein